MEGKNRNEEEKDFFLSERSGDRDGRLPWATKGELHDWDGTAFWSLREGPSTRGRPSQRLEIYIYICI